MFRQIPYYYLDSHSQALRNDILGLFAVLMFGSVIIIPRILHVEKLWRSEGSVEGITTAGFQEEQVYGAFMGLCPIVDMILS